jgi:hypothetical protein
MQLKPALDKIKVNEFELKSRSIMGEEPKSSIPKLTSKLVDVKEEIIKLPTLVIPEEQEIEDQKESPLDMKPAVKI